MANGAPQSGGEKKKANETCTEEGGGTDTDKAGE